MTVAAAVEPLPEGTRVQVLAGTDSGQEWMTGTVVPLDFEWPRFPHAVAVKVDPGQGFDPGSAWDFAVATGAESPKLVRADEPVRRLRAVKL